MRESGLNVAAFKQGYSSAAAAIVSADWALEYPYPMSPKVHVSVLRPLTFDRCKGACDACSTAGGMNTACLHNVTQRTPAMTLGSLHVLENVLCNVIAHLACSMRNFS